MNIGFSGLSFGDVLKLKLLGFLGNCNVIIAPVISSIEVKELMF